MQKLDIDLTKIDKAKIRKGKYLSLVLFDNRNGPDQYGNDGFVSLDVTKEEREQNVRGKIIGNWKHLGARPQDGTASKRELPAGPRASFGRPNAPMRPPVDPDLDPTGETSIPF